MNLTVISIVAICILIILFLLRMPIGYAMGVIGFVGLCVVRGMPSGYSSITSIPIMWASTYILSAIPFFILMGYLAANIGLVQDAFYVANKFVGHIRGGLAVSTAIGGAAFGAVCGDVVSASVTMCAVCLPEMRKYNYKDELSLGCIAGAGNLSFLIPPSIALITYGMLTEVSIGRLFVAGILPGILLMVLFTVTVFIQCRLDPSLANKGPKFSWRERLASVRLLWGFVVLVLLVLGGIYAGIFTPTEAGAIGVFGTVVLGLASKRLSWHTFTEPFKMTAQLTGMIFTLITCAMIFNCFIGITEVPLLVTNFLVSLPVSRWAILGIILIFYVAIGYILDINSIILLSIPIIYPIVLSMGFDPVWFGVLVVITIVIGNISPPFGLVIFAIAGVVKDVPMPLIFRGAFPFLGAMLVNLVLVVAFPQIATVLPRLME